MRLIDAVDLQGKMMDMCASGYGEEDMIDAVIEQPTVDAVPVVRCGECKWWKNNRCDNPDITILEIVNPNWFCADGERRTE